MKHRLFDFFYRFAVLLSGFWGLFLLFQEKSEIKTIGFYGYSWRKILLVTLIVFVTLSILLISYISKKTNPRKFSILIKVKHYFLDKPIALKILIYFLAISGVFLFINLRFISLYPANYFSILQMKILGFYVFALLIDILVLLRLLLLHNLNGLLSCLRPKIYMNFFEYFILILITFAVFSPIIDLMIFESTRIDSDFSAHINWAKQLLESPEIVPGAVISHSAWQIAVLTIHILIGQSWSVAGFVVTLITLVLTNIILFVFFRKKLSVVPSVLLSVGLSIVAPIAIFYPVDEWMYLGYIGISSYHNPTILLLRPLAILQFLIATKVIQGRKAGWIEIALTAFISAFAVFSKPNYALCLLPSLGVLSLFRIWKKKPIDWMNLILGIGLPSILVLTWQYFRTYGGAASESQTIFAPFQFMKVYSSHLLAKFVLSISYPLIATLLFWKQAIKDEKMQLAWVGFGIGAVLTYFFTESGPRFTDGNFLWSGIISLFILFIISSYFLIEQKLIEKKWYVKWPIFSLGLLHVLSGIFFIYIVMTTWKFL